MTTTQIDTGKAARRTLKFGSFKELWADVERIAAAEKAGRLRRTGNWSAGQVMGHLATWVNYPYDGYPPELRPPWFIKLILKMQKNKFLRGPMPAGVRIPKIKEGTMGTKDMSLDEGMAQLRRAWDRLLKSPPEIDNPIFGKMTHEEWIAGHLRHAELHLGFLNPD